MTEVGECPVEALARDPEGRRRHLRDGHLTARRGTEDRAVEAVLARGERVFDLGADPQPLAGGQGPGFGERRRRRRKDAGAGVAPDLEPEPRLGEILAGKGKAILLRYQEGSESTAQREQGFLDTLAKEHPGVELVSKDLHAGATPESSYQRAQNVLTSFREKGIDFVDGAYRGIAVPKGTPDELKQAISDAFTQINGDEGFAQQMREGGYVLVDVEVDEVGRFMSDGLEAYTKIGKLIGLMSLQALPRRITLDFRDVFSKGFQFDRIAAAAQVVPDDAMGGREHPDEGKQARVVRGQPVQAHDARLPAGPDVTALSTASDCEQQLASPLARLEPSALPGFALAPKRIARAMDRIHIVARKSVAFGERAE